MKSYSGFDEGGMVDGGFGHLIHYQAKEPHNYKKYTEDDQNILEYRNQFQNLLLREPRKVTDVVTYNDHYTKPKDAPPLETESLLIYSEPLAILPTKIIQYDSDGNKIGETILDDRVTKTDLNLTSVDRDYVGVNVAKKVLIESLVRTSLDTRILLFISLVSVIVMVIGGIMGSTSFGILGFIFFLLTSALAFGSYFRKGRVTW